MDGTPQEAKFSISSSFENVANLALEVSQLCSEQPGMDPEATDLLRLCVAEALNNIVEHAYDGAEGRPIFADVKFAPDKLEVLLIDEGKAMPKGQVPTGEREIDFDDLDSLPEGGFGWMLINTQMDDVDYERREGCNVLRLGKNLVA